MKHALSWNGKFLVCDLIKPTCIVSFNLFLISVACFSISDMKIDTISVAVLGLIQYVHLEF